MIGDKVIGDHCVHFPRDVFYQLSHHLSPRDLVMTSLVNTLWHQYSQDNEIWQEQVKKTWSKDEVIENSCWKEYYRSNFKRSFVNSLKCFPDKVISTKENDIIFFDPQTGSKVFKNTAHKGFITQFLSHPYQKANFYFSTGSDGYLKIWNNVFQSPPVYSQQIHQKSITSMFIFEKKIYTGSSDSTIKIFQINETVPETYPISLSPNLLETLETLEIEPDRKKSEITAIQLFKENVRSYLLFSASSNGTISIWHKKNKESFSPFQTLQAHQGIITVLKLQNRTESLFSGSTDKTIKIWKKLAPFYQCMQQLNTHEATISSILLDPFDTIFYSTGLDGKIFGYRYSYSDEKWLTESENNLREGDDSKIIFFEFTKNSVYKIIRKEFCSLTSAGQLTFWLKPSASETRLQIKATIAPGSFEK